MKDFKIINQKRDHQARIGLAIVVIAILCLVLELAVLSVEPAEAQFGRRSSAGYTVPLGNRHTRLYASNPYEHRRFRLEEDFRRYFQRLEQIEYRQRVRQERLMKRERMLKERERKLAQVKRQRALQRQRRRAQQRTAVVASNQRAVTQGAQTPISSQREVSRQAEGRSAPHENQKIFRNPKQESSSKDSFLSRIRSAFSTGATRPAEKANS